MKRLKIIKHEFVEFIPKEIADETLYISIQFATAAHKCCCGCGSEVVTPLTPRDWQLTFDGESVSLYPSIGNWSFTCRSHYWIRNNKVIWATRWSEKEIRANRNYDAAMKRRFFKRK